MEPYLPQGPTTRDFEAVMLGDGELWVMGDNRENSSDNRVFGPIAADDGRGPGVREGVALPRPFVPLAGIRRGRG